MKRWLLSMSDMGAVTDVDGDTYVTSSDIDPDRPYRRGALIQAASKIKNTNLHVSIKEK
jgi:hypothetical protein